MSEDSMKLVKAYIEIDGTRYDVKEVRTVSANESRQGMTDEELEASKLRLKYKFEDDKE